MKGSSYRPRGDRGGVGFTSVAAGPRVPWYRFVPAITSRMRVSTWASRLALLGASVLTGALVVSIDDGSASDGAVSLASAAPSKIAFIRTSVDPDGEHRFELHVMNADGSGSWRLETARLTPPAHVYELDTGGGNPGPVWSPDGRKIAFVGMGDDGNVDVYVVGADGLGLQRLTRHPGVDGNPAWSPDGRTIAFTRRPREWGAGTFRTHIYVMDADGSRQRRLAEGNVHFSVAWSPDGEKMLFERPDWRLPPGVVPGEFAEELYSMNADGSGQRRLTRSPDRDKDPVWSPDGRRIAFPRGRDLWLMNPDGSGQRNLTPAAHLWSGGANWSPDGRKLAFTRRARVWDVGKTHIYVMNADGSERRRLTQRGGGPEWSPDGRMIAFDGPQRYRLDPTPLQGIFVMNADGSERRRLTQSGGSPAWSSDGKMIAFDRSVASGMALVVMTADGSRKRVLMRADSWFRFAWSPTQR
jgi:Tol biopolymer transport system component